jgi:hypothetical protein
MAKTELPAFPIHKYVQRCSNSKGEVEVKIATIGALINLLRLLATTMTLSNHDFEVKISPFVLIHLLAQA